MEKERKIIVGGEEYLTQAQLAKREGFTTGGLSFRLKKLNIGVKFSFSPRTFYPLKDVERLEKEGAFAKISNK